LPTLDSVGGVTDASRNPAATSRRSQLFAIKLRALVDEHVGHGASGADASDAETFARGAALLRDGVAWVFVDGRADRSLGTALVWAVRRSATQLHVIAEHDTGLLARRAKAFSLPITVWFADGRTLLPAIAEPLPSSLAVTEEHDALRSMIADAGATPNAEHGVLFGEVRGLEVCRVVDSPTTGFLGELSEWATVGTAGVRLEVGVGAADREAFQMLHGEIPTVDALANIVSTVEAHRSAGSPQHPLNRLGIERFLRWQAEETPALVGCTELTPAEPPVPRPNLKDPVPCVAHGIRADGTTARVVFSSGVDLDVLPFVSDVQSMGDEPVVLVLPERDLLPVVAEAANLLERPVTIVGLPSSPSR
jgi:hypothetical protein